MSSENPMNRRRFFREGLRELLRPLGGAVDKFAEAARQIGALESMVPSSPEPSPPPAPQNWLRPPGAVSESMFGSMCTRCGDCVRACPAQCIQMEPASNKALGAPYIDPDHSPCVVCDGLLCMSSCPTGALVPLSSKEAIDMGTALWHEDTCLRHTGGSCTLCVDKCPLGSEAITLREGRIEVISDGCIGCGVCQHACPTYPKSITVIPRT